MATIEDLLRKANGLPPKRTTPVRKKKSTLVGSSAGALDNYGNVIRATPTRAQTRERLRKMFDAQELAAESEMESVKKSLAKAKLQRARRDREICDTADLLKRVDGDGNEHVDVHDIALALDVPDDVVEETLQRVWT